ncbi:MAG: response regulator [Spirochaetaceae bacterium]|jgi:signal transduction histidine kinase/ActR/RegA family two-component response regulator|nr:response regulator [Spirochaetaceae bacterium]
MNHPFFHRIRVLLVIFLGVFFTNLSLRAKTDPAFPTVLGEYSSYRDIPGVTEEEIVAIESLRRSTPLFTYGMTLSTECFRDEDNTTRGFAALMCDWLTELFGIKFRPVIFEWDTLLRGLDSHDCSFSGEIASSLHNGTYFMTDSIAERRIKFVSIEGSNRLVIIGRSRPLRYGFLIGATTEALVSPYIRQNYESVPVSNYNEAYQKLILKDIDALFVDETVRGIFSLYGNLMIEDFLPLTYNMVSMATRDPKLAPIISVVQKYLQSAGSYHFVQMYETGNEDYLHFNLLSRLTGEERDYLNLHQAGKNPIPVSIDRDNYPVSFFNKQENEWQGIAVDMLGEIEKLTGMYFVYVNSPADTQNDTTAMLRDGIASMTMELIRSASPERDYLLADDPYLIDYYVLISGTDYQDITLSDVPYKQVGLISGTAYAEIFDELFPNHINTVVYKNRYDAIAGLEKGDIDLLMGTRNLLLCITNYMERTGYKANLVLRRPYESAFGFNRQERILCSIVNKAQGLIDTEQVVDNWTRRVFDYSGALARAQIPYLAGASLLLILVLFLLMVMLIRNQQMSAQLEETVAQRTHELEERSKELEVQTAAAQVASRAKGDFLARMSHEIRTPLNAIIGMTGIARRAETIKKKDDSLDRITTASVHLLGILNDILDMSKIESGKFTIVREPFCLLPAMEEVENIILQRCEEKEMTLIADFTGLSNRVVLGDKLRLKQVLINLLGNAVKFTPEKGILKFLVNPMEGGAEGQLRVRFQVSDSGIGMTAEQMKNLFTVFEQADRSISVRFGGTGLGLAISQNLVKLMGGLITVESTFGKGSVFTFTLDMDIAETVASEAPPNPETIRGLSGKRILLVEDIEINRMILVELLEGTELQIEEAGDGIEALNRFSASTPGYYDLIFMDVQMPNMDGYEATRRIRALSRNDAQTVPIIAMTANVYREDIDHALAAGMNGHLAKPIDIGAVLKILNKWLGSGE